MADLVDPMTIIQKRLETAAQRPSGASTFETRLEPPPGAQVSRLTVAGAYRNAIPILYDFQTRTAYPVSSEG